MKDYREIMISYLKFERSGGEKTYKDLDEDEKKRFMSYFQANHLICELLEKRFKNELKQQNNNKEKAYDFHTAKKNLDYLRFYTEECLMLSFNGEWLTLMKRKEEFENLYELRKEMRRILNNLHLVVNNGGWDNFLESIYEGQ